MNLIVRLIFLACIAVPAFGATQVDINSADARTLAQSLDGVGLVKAEAIVAYRNAHGPFNGLDDLAKVKGIGPHIIEDNRESIVFGRAPVAPAPVRGGSPTSLATW
jgi:competence protein ComEA